MSHIFVCYGGIWKEDERDYLGGNLGGLEVRCDIEYDEFLLQLYELSGVDPNRHNFILRCLHNLGFRVPTYLIRNDQELEWGGCM